MRARNTVQLKRDPNKPYLTAASRLPRGKAWPESRTGIGLFNLCS